MDSFADLKDQLIEKLQSMWLRIQESDAFISLKERFENLPQTYQTLVKVFLIIFVTYFIYSIPANIMTESEDKEELFVENRELTRDIIKAGRLSRSIQLPPPAQKGSLLQNTVKSVITKQQVLPEQIKPLSEKPNVAGKKLVSKRIDQTGLAAKTTGLNLRQLVNIAQDLDAIQGIRLINMTLQSDSKDPHFFNVDYELASFDVPFEEDPVIEPEKNKKGKKKKKKKGRSKK